jgi:hypothetical protein
MASRTIRSLILAALLTPAGCIVGPQEDIPDQPPGAQEGDDRDGNVDAFGPDGDDPILVEEHPDGFYEGSDTDAHAPPSGGKTIREIVVEPGAPIPHGGWPQPRSDGPDVDASSRVPVPSSDFGDDDLDESGDPDC